MHLRVGGKMAERMILIDKLRLNYEGLFKFRDVYNMIDQFFEDKAYNKNELLNVEVVKPEGKFIEIEIEPWRTITDYVKRAIHLRMQFVDVKEVEIEKDGRKIRMNQGKISIVFDALLLTDHENRWEMTPFTFFIRTVWEKYVYKPFIVRFSSGAKKDCMELYHNLKAFLNMYRHY